MEYVVGDVHGNLQAWRSMLLKIQLKRTDNLYILGDVIDRGLHGIKILQQIIHSPNMHMILGNHEYMMCNALGFPYEVLYEPDGDELALWYHNGGDVTHRKWDELTQEEQKEIKNYLVTLPLNRYVEVDGKIFTLVHASWEALWKDELLDGSMPFFCVWDRNSLFDHDEDLEGTYICGHTPTFIFDTDKIWHGKHVINIDCGAAYPGGKLACIRLNDMKEFYS